MNARWQVAQPTSEIVSALADKLELSPLFTSCLVNRGCSTPEQAGEYLAPKLAGLTDPFLLPNIERAVDRLLQAHASDVFRIDAIPCLGELTDGLAGFADLFLISHGMFLRHSECFG